jgi:hypothetical protein
MNPIIALELAKHRQADLLAEAASARLAASVKAGKTSSSKFNGAWRLRAAFAAIVAALVR